MIHLFKSLQSQDLKALTWPLTLLIVAVLGSVGVFALVQSVNEQAATRANLMAQQLSGLRSSIADIAQEEATIVRYIDQYRLIEGAGGLRAEDRLQLLQTLDNLRTEIGLYQMSVNIDNQQRTDLRNRFNLPDVQQPIYLTSSRLNIKFSLVHEQDLIRFLSALEQAGSLSIVEQCSLTETTMQLTTLARFAVECLITWLTFEVPGPLTEASANAV